MLLQPHKCTHCFPLFDKWGIVSELLIVTLLLAVGVFWCGGVWSYATADAFDDLHLKTQPTLEYMHILLNVKTQPTLKYMRVLLNVKTQPTLKYMRILLNVDDIQDAAYIKIYANTFEC